MSSAVPGATDDRLHALDGLRGAAALAVFFYHVVTYVPLPDWARSSIDWTPLGLLCNGPGAVHVFFVLSGYVLALTLSNDTGAGRVPRYYVRRIFRIHPPYMAAVLLAWVASRLFLEAPSADPQLRWPPIPAALLPRALAFPSMAFGLLPVGWSLFVEMAMSMLFPLLFLVRRIHPAVPLIAAIFLLRDLDPRIQFLRFAIDFAIGLTLRLEADRAARAVAMLPPIAPTVLALVGLGALQAPMTDALATVGYQGLERGNTPHVVSIFAAGAGLLLLGTLHAPRLQSWLSTPIARFFGRISYSFYLVHHTVLLSFLLVAERSGGAWPETLAAVVVAFAVSVAAGALGWRAIEAPSIRAGRALIRRLSGPATAP